MSWYGSVVTSYHPLRIHAAAYAQVRTNNSKAGIDLATNGMNEGYDKQVICLFPIIAEVLS